MESKTTSTERQKTYHFSLPVGLMKRVKAIAVEHETNGRQVVISALEEYLEKSAAVGRKEA